jgi:DNA mismatch endonuclease (patch repair protein)
LADNLSQEQRSNVMRKVKARNTSPEITIRKLLRAVGETGYRLHRKDLPGKPDIAFIGRKLAIFVHGCYWHGHDCARGKRVPKSNQEYWIAKITKNKARDCANKEQLEKSDWKILIIWECEIKNKTVLSERIYHFFQQSVLS